jgi:dienelactone hydrolase
MRAMSRLRRRVVVAFLFALAAASAGAQEVLQAALHEEVAMLPAGGGVALETTLYRPRGDGPFPLAIVNHGLAGEPRGQGRARYLYLARELVRRGWAVAVPMRRGFSRSGGAYRPHPCDAEANGRDQAADVQAVLALQAQRADIDAHRVVVIGQSAGGLATLALGAARPSGVVALVNFAGGLREERCPGWTAGLAQAVARLAAPLPSLWIYGDNDAVFPPPLWRSLYASYTAAGGQATLVAHGRFADDAHDLLARRDGVAVWLPPLEAFLRRLGLPFEPVEELELAEHEAPLPAPSGFAAIGDAAAVPQVGEAGRAGYRRYLAVEGPRAFAIADDGAWAWHGGDARAMALAVSTCESHARGRRCRLYAVDDRVVWRAAGGLP